VYQYFPQGLFSLQRKNMGFFLINNKIHKATVPETAQRANLLLHSTSSSKPTSGKKPSKWEWYG